MLDLTPMTREEKFLNGDTDLTPITRREHFYAGTESTLPEPEPITREEWFIQKYRGGSGGDITVESLSVTENGTYTAPSGKAYSPVNVNVPLPQNTYLLKSVPNLPQAIASFNDGQDMVMPSLKVAIEPQQEGSGDPSPTNIRPIIGWDEAVVTRTGKNLFDVSKATAYKVMTENGEVDNGAYSHSDYIKVLPNTLYFLSNVEASAGISIFCNYDKNKNFIGYSANAGLGGRLRQTLTNTAYIVVNFKESIKNEMMICMSSIEETYEPYNGATYTIDLDGTRYGGEVDVVSGVLTVDRRMVDLGTLNWTAQTDSQGTYFRSLKPNNMKSVQSGVIPNVLCSIYPITVSSNVYDGSIAFSVGSEGYTFVRDTRFTDATAFKQAISGVQLVYELATLITVQLTPTAVKSLLGQNNVWADTGDITDAEYFSKEV